MSALAVAVVGCTTPTAGRLPGSAAACSAVPKHALGIRFGVRTDPHATLPADVPRPDATALARCRLVFSQLDLTVPVLAYPAAVLTGYARALHAAGWNLTDSAVVIGFYAKPGGEPGRDLVLLLAGDYLLVGYEGS